MWNQQRRRRLGARQNQLRRKFWELGGIRLSVKLGRIGMEEMRVSIKLGGISREEKTPGVGMWVKSYSRMSTFRTDMAAGSGSGTELSTGGGSVAGSGVGCWGT